MHYEINVSKGLQHLFATHPRSLTTSEEAEKVWDMLVKAFPECTISMTRYTTSGEQLKVVNESKDCRFCGKRVIDPCLTLSEAVDECGKGRMKD